MVSRSVQLQCDLLIIGAGPAGLAATKTALAQGFSVILLDDNPQAGGQIWRQGVKQRLPTLAKEYLALLCGQQKLRYFANSQVVAVTGQQLFFIAPEHSGQISYQKLILCVGAREKLLPFPGWTLNGVTGAGGLQALIKNGLPIARQKVVVAGSGPLLLATGKTVQQAGGQLIGIVEQVSWSQLRSLMLQLVRWPNKFRQAIMLQALKRYYTNSLVVAALGDTKLEAVQLRRGKQRITLACDRLACGFGLRPNTELAQLLNCQLTHDAIKVNKYQQTNFDHIYAAGECTGIGGSELALLEGQIASLHAIGHHHALLPLLKQRQKWQQFADTLARYFTLSAAVHQLADAQTIICRCEDIPFDQLTGFTDWQQAKMATRCGMGACQGKICGAIAQDYWHWPLPAPRQPLIPVAIEQLVQLPIATNQLTQDPSQPE